MSEVTKITYSIRQAAAASGLSISLLYKLSARRVLPILKVGRRCLVNREEFEIWLKRHRVEITNEK